MNPPERILVAIDEADGSRPAIEWAGRLAALSPALQLVLVHVLAPTPPSVMERPSTVDPVEEAELAQRADRAEARWREKAVAAARDVLEVTRSRLVAAGVRTEQISTDYYAPDPESSVAEGLIDAVEERGCSAIVLGRESLPWYRELFRRHVSDEVLGSAEDLVVCIVT